MGVQYSYDVDLQLKLKGKDVEEQIRKQIDDATKGVLDKTYKIKIGAEEDSVKDIINTLKGLDAKVLANVVYKVDMDDYMKTLKQLEGYSKKTGKQIAASFKQSFEDEYEPLSISDLIKQDGGKRYTQQRMRGILDKLSEDAFQNLDNTSSYSDILKKVGALKQLISTMKELQSLSANKGKGERDDYGAVFNDKKYGGAQGLTLLEQTYADLFEDKGGRGGVIGKLLKNNDVRDKYINDIYDVINGVRDKLLALFQGIIEPIQDSARQAGEAVGTAVSELTGEVSGDVGKLNALIKELEAKNAEIQKIKSNINQRRFKLNYNSKADSFRVVRELEQLEKDHGLSGLGNDELIKKSQNEKDLKIIQRYIDLVASYQEFMEKTGVKIDFNSTFGKAMDAGMRMISGDSNGNGKIIDKLGDKKNPGITPNIIEYVEATDRDIEIAQGKLNEAQEKAEKLNNDIENLNKEINGGSVTGGGTGGVTGGGTSGAAEAMGERQEEAERTAAAAESATEAAKQAKEKVDEANAAQEDLDGASKAGKKNGNGSGGGGTGSGGTGTGYDNVNIVGFSEDAIKSLTSMFSELDAAIKKINSSLGEIDDSGKFKSIIEQVNELKASIDNIINNITTFKDTVDLGNILNQIPTIATSIDGISEAIASIKQNADLQGFITDINAISITLSQIQSTFKLGFGISEKEGDLNYLQQLIDKLDALNALIPNREQITAEMDLGQAQEIAYGRISDAVSRYMELGKRIFSHESIAGDEEEFIALTDKITGLLAELENSPLYNKDLAAKVAAPLVDSGDVFSQLEREANAREEATRQAEAQAEAIRQQAEARAELQRQQEASQAESQRQAEIDKIIQQSNAYKELSDAVERAYEIIMRLAKNDGLPGDVEEADELIKKIAEIRQNIAEAGLQDEIKENKIVSPLLGIYDKYQRIQADTEKRQALREEKAREEADAKAAQEREAERIRALIERYKAASKEYYDLKKAVETDGDTAENRKAIETAGAVLTASRDALKAEAKDHKEVASALREEEKARTDVEKSVERYQQQQAQAAEKAAEEQARAEAKAAEDKKKADASAEVKKKEDEARAAAEAAKQKREDEIKSIEKYNQAIKDYYDAQKKIQTGQGTEADQRISDAAKKDIDDFKTKYANINERSEAVQAALDQEKRKQEELNAAVERYNKLKNEETAKTKEDKEVENFRKAVYDYYKAQEAIGKGRKSPFSAEELNNLKTIIDSFIAKYEKLDDVSKRVRSALAFEDKTRTDTNIAINEHQSREAEKDNRRAATQQAQFDKAVQAYRDALDKMKGAKDDKQFDGFVQGVDKAIEKLKEFVKQGIRTQDEIDQITKDASSIRKDTKDRLDKESDLKKRIAEYKEAVKTYYELQEKIDAGKTTADIQGDKYKKAVQIKESFEKDYKDEASSVKEIGDAFAYAAEKQQEYEINKRQMTEDNQKKQIASTKKEIESMAKATGKVFEKNTDVFTNEGVNKFKELQDRYAAIKEEIDNIDWNGKSEKDLEDLKKRLNDVNTDIKNLFSDKDFLAVSKLQSQTLSTRMSQWMDNNSAAQNYFPQVKALQEELQNTVSRADYDRIAEGFQRIAQDAADAGRTGKSFGESLATSFKNMSRYLLTFASFYRVIGVIKQGLNIVKEFDTALMEIRKVSDEATSSLREFQMASFDMADQVGTTAIEIQKSAADWMRLGKSFKEAQKAAKASTWLLNVSEFTNIDDATKSLISITQAFKNLSYDDVIDKLNNVGDHFSSSTDQLASGLQNTAAVLKVQGNDIDQSLALLTAANNITQDMSKASMGVRTVALRIAGTKEAKEELEEMGEDTSDFVVQTASKVDAQVRKYTATAKNPNGVSVLDNTGRLRNTYDILLDISKVYSDIVEKDNKFGTNASNALLELLAGKTRSNILASILQDPNLLEEAYVASTQSQGVGQMELNAYLDSIEAKLAQLKNRLSELAAVTIDSSWLKSIIDFGTGAIKVVTTLSKSIGGLNIVIGALVGGFLQKTGYGLLNYDKTTGITTKGISRIRANIKDFIANHSKQRFVSDEIGAYFEGVKPEQYEATVKDIGENAPQEVQEYVNSLQGAERETLTMGKLIEHFQTNVFSLGGVLKSVGGLALNFVSTMGTMFISMAASWAVSKIIEGFTNYINRVQIAIDKGKEAQAQIAEINEGFSKQQKTVANFDAERFVDLSSRKNDVSFTTDEYNELAEVSNQLIELFPSLAGEFDSQGNAVINLGGNVEEVTTKLADLLAQERELADFKITQNLPDVVAGIGYQNDALYKEIEEQNKVIESYKETQSFLREGKDVETANLSLTDNGFRVFAENANEGDLNFREIIEEAADKAWKESGVAFRNTFSTDVYNATTGKLGSYEYFDLGAIGEEEAEKFWSAFKIAFTDMSKEIDINLADALKIKAADEREIRANWNSIKPSLISAMNTDVSFFDLQDRGDFGKQMRDTIVKNLNNVDIMDMMMSGDYEEFEKNPRRWVRQKFIDPITNAFYDNEGNYNAENQGLVEQLLRLDSSDLNIKEYRKKVMEIVKQIFPEDFAEGQEFLVSLGIRDEDYKFEADNMINELAEATGVSAQEIREGVGQKDLHLLYNVYAEGKMDFKGSNFEQLLKYIETLNAEQAGHPDGILSEVFNDEGYKEKAETFEKAASSLSSSMDTIRQNGKLTADEMRDLQEDFPDLTDFSYDGLSTKLAKNMTNWVDEIRSHWKEMGFEGQEQMETYVRNLVRSYGKNIDIADQDLNKMIVDSLLPEGTSGYERKSVQDYVSTTMSDLQELAEGEGIELDNRIIWELMLNDEFTGDAEQIFAKYKDIKMVWDIILGEDTIERLEEARSLLDAQTGLKEARGGKKTAEDYEADRAISEGIINENVKKMNGQTERQQKKIMTDIYNERAKQEQSLREQQEAEEEENIARWQRAITFNQNTIDDIQKNISNPTTTPTSAMYQEMITAGNNQMQMYEFMADYYERTRDSYENDPERWSEYNDKLHDVNNSMIELTNQQREWNEEAERLSKIEGSFSVIFENEDYVKHSDATLKELNSVTTALEELRNEGRLTENTKIELRKVFPDLGDSIVSDDLVDKGIDKINEFVSQTRKAMSGLSEDAKQQGEQYLKDTIMSLGYLGVSEDDVRNSFLDIYGSDGGSYGRKNAAEWYDSTMSELQSIAAQNGEELNMDVIYTLIASDQFSGDAQEIYDKYKDLDIEWNVVINNDELLRQLDKDMELTQKRIETTQGERDLLETKGETPNEGWYSLSNFWKELDYNLAKQAEDIAYDSYTAVKGTDLEDSKYGEYLDRVLARQKAEGEYFNSVIEQQEFPVNELEETITNQQNTTAKSIQNIMSHSLNYGKDATADMLQMNADYLRDEQTNYESLAEMWEGIYETRRSAWGEDNKHTKAALEKAQEARSSALSTEEQVVQNEAEQRQAPIKALSKDLQILQNDAQNTQNEITRLQNSGQEVGRGLYQTLIDNASEQRKILESQREEALANIEFYRTSPQYGVNSQYYIDAKQQLTEIDSQIIQLDTDTKSWKQTLETGLELNELQSNLEIIKNDAQDIQDAMSLKESRGIKSTYKDYDRLIKNSKQQISNIKRQNVLLRNQQSQILDKNNDTWKEINNQIIANNREIATLSQSQYDWGQQMVMNSINNAMANIDALDTAMSKGHMDDAESILTLIRANRDYADVLTSTTTGVYADAQALAQLKQEELDLIVAQTDAKKAAEWANYEKNERDMLSLAHAIDPTIESIDQLYDALMRNPDNPQWARIMDMAETNQGILQTIDQLQAAKEEALALSSALGKYQNALSTPNWSDPMQTIRGGMEGAKKLWDQGWVGRDDFTTFANLIATNAEVGTEDAIINFEKNYERMSKYLTEDTSGVHKWVDDMTEKASKFVKMGKDGVEFFDVDNMKEFADLMGTSTEMAEYMLMAMKDAGYNVDISRIGDEFSRTFDTISGTEANAKQLIKNLVADMGEAAKSGVDISTYADAAAESFQRLRDAGVDEEWIQEQIDILNELGKDNGFYIDPQTLEVTTKVDRAELEETEKEITDPKEMLVNVKTEYGIEDVDVTNVSNAIQRAFEGNKENIKQSLKDSGLSEFSLSDLIDIKFDDGQYSEGEAALEDLAVRIGLVGDKSEVTTEMAQTLIYTLAQLGLIDVEPEVDTSEVEKANKEIEKPGVKKIKYKTEWVEETDSGTGNPGKRNGFNISEEAQSRLSYYRKIVEAREASETKYNENKESQQPMIDSVNNLGEGFDKSVDTGASKITDAISKAADTIVTGITGKSTEDGIVDNPGYKHAEEGYNTNVNKTTSSSTSSTSTDTQITPQSLSGSMTTSYTAVATVDYEVGNTKEVEQTTEELTKPEEKEVDVNIKQKGETGVKDVTSTNTVETNMDMSGLDTGLQMLHSIHPVVPIDGDSKGFMGESAIVKQEKGVLGQAVNIPVRAQDQASGVINSIINTVNSIPLSKVVSVSTKISGMPQLENLRNVIGGLKDKFVNIFNQVHTTAVGGGGATGTAHVSHATGTAYSMWEGYRHSIGAYANGTSEDWSLSRDEDALVNEVGTESIVRDGKWFTLPGGAHIEQLKKNDIVFSAAQTRELIKYGKVYSGGGHGKVAYANGTAYNTLNARASGQISRATTQSTRLSDISRRNVGASPSSSSAPASNGAINQNTEVTKENTKAANKASGSLDAFKNWVETLFDWIEVRVERLTYKIDLSQARSENTNGYSGKNKQLNNAMRVIGALGTKKNTKTNRWTGGSGLLQDAQNGAIRYMEQATKVRQKAIANGLVDAKTADNIIKLIKEGAINISEYNEKTREFIQQYKEW